MDLNNTCTGCLKSEISGRIAITRSSNVSNLVTFHCISTDERFSTLGTKIGMHPRNGHISLSGSLAVNQTINLLTT